jgi:ribose/xylose/arabinose/galactoside ABC-type transport system permease subunit
MMIVLQGFRFAYTGGAPSGALPDGFRALGTGRVLGLPINLLALLLIAALFGFLLHATPFGRKVYIVGGNPEAARLCGIAVDRVRIACYVISSVLAGIAGLFLVGYVGSIDNWVGRGYELDSIVACVMGGVAITGGRGSIFGALAGALILIILFNLVLLLGFQVQWQYVLKGVIIIAAAAFYLNRSR